MSSRSGGGDPAPPVRPHLARWVPPGLMLLGIAYVAFALGLEVRTMPGDPGYDPGGRAVPLAAGLVLAVLAALTVLRDALAARLPDGVEPGAVSRRSAAPATADDGAGGSDIAALAPALAGAVGLYLLVGTGFLFALGVLGFALAAGLLLASLIWVDRGLAGAAASWPVMLATTAVAAALALGLAVGLDLLLQGVRGASRAVPALAVLGDRHAQVALGALALALATLLLRRLHGACGTALPASLILLPAVMPSGIVLGFNRLFLTRLPVFPAPRLLELTLF